MKTQQRGFTLIEIAIVLVIIGLLLGGILKGQELINSAKVKNLAADFKNIPVFIYSYQDKFKSLPGDDAQGQSHVGNSASTALAAGQAHGNGVIEGVWVPSNLADETLLFWQQVRLAGLAAGATALPATSAAIPSFLPSNAFGGAIGIQSGATASIEGMHGTQVICSTGILGKFAAELDSALDDGNAGGGAMMATANAVDGSGTGAAPATTLNDAAAYTVCMGV